MLELQKFKQVVDQERRPNQSFQEADHAGAKGSGQPQVINEGAQETEEVRPAAGIAVLFNDG